MEVIRQGKMATSSKELAVLLYLDETDSTALTEAIDDYCGERDDSKDDGASK